MKHLILGTAGHIDHGKTALIKALTDIDCDTHKEEKERGITINLGFSHLTLPSGESVGIVDVPGHKDFIKTMVAGAFGIDVVLLTVAADSGIMPQTAEHIHIVEMLGVKHGIVVLTKADLVDNEMLELAQLEVEEFLEGTVFESAPVVAVSSLTGTGIDKLKETISQVISRVEREKAEGFFRMYIDRIFNVKGIGFVVTGSVLDGGISTGKEVFLLPGNNKKVKIRGIQRHGETVEKVFPGDRAALNISGIKSEEFQRGMLLSEKNIDESNMIDATITLFDIKTGLGLWSKVIFYAGTFESAVRMHLLDKDTCLPGESAIVQIHLDKPAVLLNGDRFIIRNSSNDLTLGGGVVIDPYPLHHRKRTPKLIETLKDLAGAVLNSDTPFNLIKIELKKVNSPVFAAYLAEKSGKPVGNIIEEIENNNDGSIFMLPHNQNPVLLPVQKHSEYKELISVILKDWHDRNSILEEGLEKDEFYGKLGFNKNEAGKIYLDFLVEDMTAQGILKKTGNTYALADHSVHIDPKTEEQLKWLEKMYENAGIDIPLDHKIEEAALKRKIKKEKLKMLQKYLVKQNILVFYQGVYLHVETVNKCRKLLLNDLKDKERGINEKEVRLLLNTSKKFVQLILGILIDEDVIFKRTFFVMLTEKGKEMAKNLI